MRCYICNFDPAFNDKSDNYLTRDKETGKDICAICLEAAIEALTEFGVDDCSEEYKKTHDIKSN